MCTRNKLLAVVLFVFVALSLGCAKVNFSPMASNKKEDTVFTKYLKGEVDRNYMVEWMFLDVEDFRSKAYGINQEIIERGSLNQQEQDKTLVLQYELNLIIQEFNKQNRFSRAYQITKSMVSRAMEEGHVVASMSPSEVRKNGAPPKSISNSNWGVTNSILKNGFIIEEVHFLDPY